MCQKNGTFKTASLCGSDEICIGPFTEKNAVKGIKKLCQRGNVLYHFPGIVYMAIKSWEDAISYYNHFINQGIFCGIDDALSLACNQCPKFNDSWCGGHCIFDELSQECKEGNQSNLFN